MRLSPHRTEGEINKEKKKRKSKQETKKIKQKKKHKKRTRLSPSKIKRTYYKKRNSKTGLHPKQKKTDEIAPQSAVKKKRRATDLACPFLFCLSHILDPEKRKQTKKKKMDRRYRQAERQTERGIIHTRKHARKVVGNTRFPPPIYTKPRPSTSID